MIFHPIILIQVSNGCRRLLNKDKSARAVHFDQEKMVNDWFVEQRLNRICISRLAIRRKMMQLVNENRQLSVQSNPNNEDIQAEE